MWKSSGSTLNLSQIPELLNFKGGLRLGEFPETFQRKFISHSHSFSIPGAMTMGEELKIGVFIQFKQK